MASALLMNPVQSASARQSTRSSVASPSAQHTTCMFGRRSSPFARQHRIVIPNSFYNQDPRRSGGSFGPGFAWGQAFGPGFMNKPLSEILQQIEKEVSQYQTPDFRQSKRGDGSRPTPEASNGLMSVPVDSIENDDAIVYFLDVPGLEKSDLKIQVNQQERTLTISGDRQQPIVASDTEGGKQVTRFQRRFGKFSTKLELPETADTQLISAKVDKGVLRVKVLKTSTAEPELQDVEID